MRPASQQSSRRNTSSTLDRQTLGTLHTALFGHDQRDFPPSWRGGFTLRGAGGLACGLTQREGGPCGVLAVVQAYTIRELIKRSEVESIDQSTLTRQEAADALLTALAHIIWAARVGRLATVVSCKGRELPPIHAAAEALTATQCNSQADVLNALRACSGVYTLADGPGIALLLYSVALTRGIAMLGRDADFPTPLIGVNGYCSQELVNLLLIGRAHSNVFDGEKNVGGDENEGEATNGGGEGCGVRLKGVPRRSLVGFLTLFERQGAEGTLLTVGSYYKRPCTAVFVVQSESHYSVLWAQGGPPADLLWDPSDRLPGDPMPDAGCGDEEDEELPPAQLADGDSIELNYYDQMAERSDAVRLTLRRAARGAEPEHAAPLELVIKTRWPAAEIDWNGEEIIL